MLFAIDHGNKQIKSDHATFTTGLQASDSAPFDPNTLKYMEKYYILSDERLPFQYDKTTDETFFILSLFAIGKEIETAGGYVENDLLDVQLAVGLPPAHYGALKERFAQYFKARDIISFEYHGKPFNIFIDSVDVFPQAFAAASTIIEFLITVSKAIIIDIGGYTVDYLVMFNGRPDFSQCGSLETGVIMLYNGIKSAVSGETGLLLDERQIDAVIAGDNQGLTPSVTHFITERIGGFINKLLAQFRERQIDLQTAHVVFTGGGAILLKEQIQHSGLLNRTSFIEDISANVKGYELLYWMQKKKVG